MTGHVRSGLLVLLLPATFHPLLHCYLLRPDSVVAAADSQRVFPVDEVVVTGTRFETLARDAPSPVSIIHINSLDARPGSLLSAGLTGIPGVVVKSYGGGAAVENAVVRGMSAEHTLVLIDGQRLNSFENGTTDLGFLSTMGFDRMEVARGGWSAVYGSDAVSGVINLITGAPAQDVRAKAEQTMGSNSYSAGEITGSWGMEDFGVAGGFRQERGRGNYEYDFSDGRLTTRLRREGDDFRILSGNIRMTGEITDATKGRLLLLYTDADRGSPGPVTDVETSGRARLHDQLGIGQAGLSWDLGKGWLGSLNGSWNYSLEHYSDPQVLLGGVPLHSYYNNRAVFLDPEVRYVASSSVTASAGMDMGYGTLTSSDVHTAHRWQQSYFLNGQVSLPLHVTLVNDVLVYPSLRYDRFSDVNGDISPRIGLNVGVLGQQGLRVRASYGKSYRAPTFNELYWIAGGNPSLTPERSLSFDAGVEAQFTFLGSCSVQSTYYSIDTRDRIVWVPQSGGYWSPHNIDRVTSRGVEVEVRWRGANGLLECGIAGAWTDARKVSADFPGDPTYDKHLIDVPGQTLDADVSFNVTPVTVYVRHSWVSFRYSTETNDQFLPHYGLTSAAARCMLPIGGGSVSFKLEVTNLFDTSYQMIAQFPMPLREFRATLGVAL